MYAGINCYIWWKVATVYITVMTTVVLNSGSLYSAFIGTIDHLPCDVGRSLWVLQSLNLAIAKEKDQLHRVLTQGESGGSELAGQFVNLRQQLVRWSRESVAEMEALCAQLEHQEALLKAQVASLEKAAESPDSQQAEKDAQLRAQLEEHYRQHPLASQVEARQEKVLRDLERVIVKQKPSSGIKIILKIPQRKDKRAEKEPDGKHRKLKLIHGPAAEPEAPRVHEPPPEEEVYCFCKQPSFGDMIGCDNRRCPNGEWFHYKCVGLLSKVEAQKYTKQKWYCSDQCREAGQKADRIRRKKRQRKW